MNLSVLAAVLHRANASPPHQWDLQQEFYNVKEQILNRLGKKLGHQQQHIEDPCWGYRDYGCDDECDKCGGSGIYRQRWFLLELWQLGQWTFHRPVRRLGGAEAKPENDIEGRIKHPHTVHARDCYRALFCLFRPGMLSECVKRDPFGTQTQIEGMRRVMRIVAAIGPLSPSLVETPAVEPVAVADEVPF